MIRKIQLNNIWLKKFLVIFMLCSATLPVVAKDFIVGVETTEYYPIYSYSNNQWVGYSRELLDAFAVKNGHRFTYRPLPVLRLFATYLHSDELDFKFPDNPQWRTDLKKTMPITYSKSAFDSIEGGMVLPNKIGKPISQLKTLGTIRGFTPWLYQTALSARTLFAEQSDDLPSLVQKGLAERIDLIFVNQTIANYHLTYVLKKPGALILDKGLPNEPVAYLLSTRKHPEIIKQFNTFLATETVLVNELKAKYKLK